MLTIGEFAIVEPVAPFNEFAPCERQHAAETRQRNGQEAGKQFGERRNFARCRGLRGGIGHGTRF
jgi:hypothetical protein